MKINPKAQEKYQVSVNILKWLRMFCVVILQHQVLLHIIPLTYEMHNGLCLPNQVL